MTVWGSLCTCSPSVSPPGRCKACLLGLSDQLFLHCVEGNRRDDQEKRTISSLYLTNTHCWIMHDRTQATRISKILPMSSDETEKKYVKHLPCVFWKTFSCSHILALCIVLRTSCSARR